MISLITLTFTSAIAAVILMKQAEKKPVQEPVPMRVRQHNNLR